MFISCAHLFRKLTTSLSLATRKALETWELNSESLPLQPVDLCSNSKTKMTTSQPTAIVFLTSSSVRSLEAFSKRVLSLVRTKTKAKDMSDKRVTMIKPVVGKVKSPSYALPDNSFVYGIESKLDKEGAGEVVQSWAQSKSSQPPQDQKSFPATNREPLKNACITAASQRDYGKQFPVMKQNPKQANSQKKKLEEGLQENANLGGGEVITSI